LRFTCKFTYSCVTRDNPIQFPPLEILCSTPFPSTFKMTHYLLYFSTFCYKIEENLKPIWKVNLRQIWIAGCFWNGLTVLPREWNIWFVRLKKETDIDNLKVLTFFKTSRRIMHGDLAARNILIGGSENYVAKVSWNFFWQSIKVRLRLWNEIFLYFCLPACLDFQRRGYMVISNRRYSRESVWSIRLHVRFPSRWPGFESRPG